VHRRQETGAHHGAAPWPPEVRGEWCAGASAPIKEPRRGWVSSWHPSRETEGDAARGWRPEASQACWRADPVSVRRGAEPAAEEEKGWQVWDWGETRRTAGVEG